MKKRLLSALLTVFTVFSLFGTVLMPAASAAENYTVFTGNNIVFKELGTTRVAGMWTFNVEAKTPGTKKVSFWIRVSDVTEPIYLVGTYFGFTTTDGSTFISHGSGTTNLQNNALYVPEAGDYLITTDLEKGNDIAWNWNEENGGFAAFTSFGISAVNARAYDKSGTVEDTTAKAALMGIIEGTPDVNKVVDYRANGQTIIKRAQNYVKGTVKGYNFNNNANYQVDKTLSFRHIINTVEAPKLDGYKFLGWDDGAGNPTISITNDALCAGYEKHTTSFIAKVTTNEASKSGTITVMLQDPDIGITSGTASLWYDKTSIELPADTALVGGVNIPFDSVPANGVIATLPFTIKQDKPLDSTITMSGQAKVNDTYVNVAERSTVVNTARFFSGSQKINNSVDGTLDQQQALWTGPVQFISEGNGFTIVYKVDGVNTPINLGNFSVNYQRTLSGVYSNREASNDDWGWQQQRIGALTISENGYYYYYFNKALFGFDTIVSLNSVNAFVNYSSPIPTEIYANRANANANATFEMLAVYANNMQVNVNFHNEDGSLYAAVPYAYTNQPTGLGWSDPKAAINGKLVGPNEILASAGKLNPVKSGSADGSVYYKFVKWVDANGNDVNNIYKDIDLYPVYNMVVDGAKTDYNVKLSTNGAGQNGQLTVKVADTDKAVSAGTVNVTYDPAWFTFASDTDKDGVIAVNYNSVAADGTVATLAYTVAANKAGNTAITVGGSVTIGSASSAIATKTTNVTVAAYIDQDAQTINKNTVGDNGEIIRPEEQILWNGKVELGEATGMTLVYKIDGVETPMILDNFGIGYTCITGDDGTTQSKNNSATWDYWWQNTHATKLNIDENGYYFIHIDRSIAGEESYVSFDSFRIFTEVNAGENAEVVEEIKKDYANRTNENENATFELLAVYRQDMVVNVTYHDINGNPHVTIPYKYTDIEGVLPGNAGLRVGKLITPDEIFKSSGAAAPIKPHDDNNFYLVDYWVDANGKRVEGVYQDIDVYPVYEAVKRGTAVTHDGASIRTGDPAGMRFTSTVSVPENWYGIEEVGTAILVGGTVLGAETTLYVPARVDVNGDKFLHDYTLTDDGRYIFHPGIVVEETQITYTGVLSNIKASNFARDFTARAYFKTVDGEYIYAYDGCTRNASAVANEALNDASTEYADAVREYLQKYIAA